VAIKLVALFEGRDWPGRLFLPYGRIAATQGHYQDHAVHEMNLLKRQLDPNSKDVLPSLSRSME
jgi:hypothetical protein